MILLKAETPRREVDSGRARRRWAQGAGGGVSTVAADVTRSRMSDLGRSSIAALSHCTDRHATDATHVIPDSEFLVLTRQAVQILLTQVAS